MRALLIRIWLFLSVLWVSFGGALAVSNDPFSAGLRDRFASLPSGVAQIGLSPTEYGRLALYLILIFCPPALLWVLGGTSRWIIYGARK